MKLKRHKDFIIKESFETLSFDNNDQMNNLYFCNLELDDEEELSVIDDEKEVNIRSYFVDGGKLTIDMSNLKGSNITFNINYLRLRSLNGCPLEVEKFVSNDNYHTNLEGGPEKALEYIIVHNEYLTSLEGCPTEVSMFNINNTNIEDLGGIEDSEMYSISLSDNYKFTSLEGLSEFTSDIHLNNCPKLTILEYIETNQLEYLYINKCPIKTLYHIKDVKINELIIEETNISDIEIEYYKSEDNIIQVDYWTGLFKYAKENDVKSIKEIDFPEEFINSLEDEDLTIIKSSKGLSKFNL